MSLDHTSASSADFLTFFATDGVAGMCADALARKEFKSA